MAKDLSILLAQLNTSGLLNSNPALYQVIKELIQNLISLQSFLTSSSSGGSSGSGGGTVVNNILNSFMAIDDSSSEGGENFPSYMSDVARLNASNVFTLINPLITLAESWIGPSSTTGIYFKDGFVGIKTTDPDGPLDVNGGIGIQVRTTSDQGVYLNTNVADARSARLIFKKSRGTYSAPADVVNGDSIAEITSVPFATSYFEKLSFRVAVDGTFTTNQPPPTRIEFHTNVANGASVERMRIDKDGNITIGASNSIAAGDAFFSSSAIRVSEVGQILWKDSTKLTAPDDGEISITNQLATAGIVFDVVTKPDTILVRDRTLAAEGHLGASTLILTTGYLFANLPATPETGTMAYVRDSDTDVWGDVIAGGGAFTVAAWYNGSDWTVYGK